MSFDFFNSERFLLVCLGAVAVVLQDPETMTRPWYVSVGKAIAIICAGAVTIGTADRLGKNIGGVKPAVTEVEDQK